MFDSRQFTFILVVLLGFFVLTDSSIEGVLKNNLWSMWGTTVEETTEIGGVAPSGIFDTMEKGRNGFVDLLKSQNDNLLLKSKENSGNLSILYSLLSLLLQLIIFLASFVIIFYPLTALILYFFFTSGFFKRRNNFY